MNLVYANLKAEMVRRHLSVLELSTKMNLSKKQLERKLNGLHEFNLKEIEFILNEFNDCNFEYLFQIK